MSKPRRIKCPEKCDRGLVYSSGDGWEEWDECRCCNPKGDNDTGTLTKRRLAEFKKEEAAAKAEADARCKAWETEMAQPCQKCGMPKGEHASREDEPCKSYADWNREYRGNQRGPNV
jgi:hypothetical protein